jgi:lipid-A-disaccharide synthase
MKEIQFQSPVFFCAGEPSGDVYAGLFVKQLEGQFPNAKIFGVGDGNMQRSGVEIVMGYERLTAFGLSDSLSSVRSHYSCYRQIVRKLLDSNSRTFVAVAYPGLNMLLCRTAKRHGMRVYYMLPPQIWAWGRFRKNLLKRWVDVIISFFPFEADVYRRFGLETILLDNPLVSSLSTYKRERRHERIGFLPGSRRSQITRNLPVVLELARFIEARRPDIELCLLAFDARSAADLRLRQSMLSVSYENRYQVMKDCDLLVVSSGTASLEAAAMRIPQIFFHRVSSLDDRILRKFVHVDEFNLANLYYGEKIVPSYVTSDAHRLERQLKNALAAHLHLSAK